MLVNGILTNCDVWYGLTKSDVEQLEQVDRLLLRQIFNVATSCPIEALYLEIGCIPISLIIKSRRLNYLHYLATRKETETLFKFFMAQWNHPAERNEWTEQVRQDLEEFEIEEDLSWIKNKSEFSFKKIVKAKAKELTLELNHRKGKMTRLFYVELELQQYLKNQNISTSQARAVFKFKQEWQIFLKILKEVN